MLIAKNYKSKSKGKNRISAKTLQLMNEMNGLGAKQRELNGTIKKDHYHDNLFLLAQEYSRRGIDLVILDDDVCT